MTNKYDYDIQYHTQKAKLHEHLQAAVRNYLAFNALVLPPDVIVNLAEELNRYTLYQQSETQRAEEFEALRVQESEQEFLAVEVIDGEIENVEEVRPL